MTPCTASVYRRPVSPPEPCGAPAKGQRVMVGDPEPRPACSVHLRMARDPFAWLPPPRGGVVSRLEFGVTTICRHCRGVGGDGNEGDCGACGGVGFTQPPPTTPDENSRAAADDLANAAQLRELVFRAIRDRGPVSDERLLVITGLQPNTLRPRRWELAKAGRIVKVGKGKTASGRSCWLWAVSAAVVAA